MQYYTMIKDDSENRFRTAMAEDVGTPELRRLEQGGKGRKRESFFRRLITRQNKCCRAAK